MAPYGSVLVVEHVDKPGVIGTIGQVLGSSGINIGAMQVGRKHAGSHAVMVLGVDDPISPQVMARLEQVEDLWDTRVVTW